MAPDKGHLQERNRQGGQLLTMVQLEKEPGGLACGTKMRYARRREGRDDSRRSQKAKGMSGGSTSSGKHVLRTWLGPHQQPKRSKRQVM